MKGEMMLARTAARIAAGETVKLVAYGDSISEVGRTPGYFGGASNAEMNWADQLGKLLAVAYPSARFVVEHFAIGGQNAYEGYGRADWLRPYQPDLVLVAFGANDAGWHFLPPDATFTALNGLVEWIQAVLGVDVMLLGSGGDNPRESSMQHFDETLAATRAAAEQRHVPYVDIRAAILDATANGERWAAYHASNQDCHPNDQGHTIWAQATFTVIQRELTNEEARAGEFTVL